MNLFYIKARDCNTDSKILLSSSPICKYPQLVKDNTNIHITANDSPSHRRLIDGYRLFILKETERESNVYRNYCFETPTPSTQMSPFVLFHVKKLIKRGKNETNAKRRQTEFVQSLYFPFPTFVICEVT